MSPLAGVLNLLALFGAVVIVACAGLLIHDFFERGINNRRARLTTEASND